MADHSSCVVGGVPRGWKSQAWELTTDISADQHEWPVPEEHSAAAAASV